jgi:ketosteroid isomerase-like protein
MDTKHGGIESDDSEYDTESGGPVAMVRRLEAATNAHDLDALVDCFAPDYENETPTHPARGFTGREQVRRNWQAIFGGVPDLQARVLRSVGSGDEVWTEWEMSGRRRDGVQHLMRGVIVFTVERGRAARARFYLEPVDAGSGDVNAAVAAAIGPAGAPVPTAPFTTAPFTTAPFTTAPSATTPSATS